MHKLIYNCTNGKRVAINIDNFQNVCTISCVKNKIHKQLRDIFKQTNKKLNNILAFINSFPLFFWEYIYGTSESQAFKSAHCSSIFISAPNGFRQFEMSNWWRGWQLVLSVWISIALQTVKKLTCTPQKISYWSGARYWKAICLKIQKDYF